MSAMEISSNYGVYEKRFENVYNKFNANLASSIDIGASFAVYSNGKLLIDLAGGFKAEDFGSLENLGLGLFVLVLIIALNRSSNQWIRLTAIVVGLVAGYIIAGFMGKLDFSNLSSLPLVSIPIPFKYGVASLVVPLVPK